MQHLKQFRHFYLFGLWCLGLVLALQPVQQPARAHPLDPEIAWRLIPKTALHTGNIVGVQFLYEPYWPMPTANTEVPIAAVYIRRTVKITLATGEIISSRITFPCTHQGGQVRIRNGGLYFPGAAYLECPEPLSLNEQFAELGYGWPLSGLISYVYQIGYLEPESLVFPVYTFGNGSQYLLQPSASQPGMLEAVFSHYNPNPSVPATNSSTITSVSAPFSPVVGAGVYGFQHTACDDPGKLPPGMNFFVNKELISTDSSLCGPLPISPNTAITLYLGYDPFSGAIAQGYLYRLLIDPPGSIIGGD